jgi:hypothetical protein
MPNIEKIAVNNAVIGAQKTARNRIMPMINCRRRRQNENCSFSSGINKYKKL